MHTAIDASPTLDVHCILRIVDGIYGAACGEATWDQALAQLCRFGGLDGGALSAVDVPERRSALLASCGSSAGSRPGATHGAIGDSPLVDRIVRSTPGDVLQHPEVLSDAAGTRSSMRVDGHLSSACVVLSRDERRAVCLEVFGGAGRAPGCAEPGDFLRQLAPHLVRAWRIGRASRAAFAASAPAGFRSQVHALAGARSDLAGLPEVARLRAEFGLTKAEARLALRLVEGSTLASSAQDFNVKLTTIRSQLQQVFAKTGTSRQSELVAMLLSCGYGSRRLHWYPAPATPAAPALAG